MIDRIESIRKEFIKAMNIFKEGLSDEHKIKRFEIRYREPTITDLLIDSYGPLEVDKEHVVYFRFPNSVINFDMYPSIKSKIGIIAHELLGHLADDDQYYNGDSQEAYSEYAEFVTPEQRANLRVFHVFPEEIYMETFDWLCSMLKATGCKIANVNEMLRVFITNEFLGRCGLKRSDNIIEVIEEVNKSGFNLTKFLVRYSCLALAGLATSPELNNSKEYGIKRHSEFTDIQREVLNYLERYTDKVREIVTNSDNYEPIYAVDLRWINRKKALRNFEKILPLWEGEAKKYKSWKCFEDRYRQAYLAYERLMKE